jgi:threonine dehydratase
LNLDDAPAEIYLKLETLQPVGSFKLRGAASAMTALDSSTLKTGVWTASAGNMGYAVAWCARRLGAPFVFPQMWPLASHLLDDSLVVSLAAVRRAIRLLALHNHIIAEGAGAVSVAAAMNGRVGAGKIVCILSGGNMDASLLVNILSEGIQ